MVAVNEEEYTAKQFLDILNKIKPHDRTLVEKLEKLDREQAEKDWPSAV
jgi:hypothetical protein